MLKKMITLSCKFFATKQVRKKAIASMLAISILSVSMFPFYPAAKAADKTVQIAQNESKGAAKTPAEEAEVLVKDLPPVQRSEERPQVSRGNLNRNEVTLLAMVIEGEAADEPYQGKVAVGAVILNRMASEQFPDTMSGVIYQDWAFESVMNGQYTRPLTNESIKAAQAAIQGSDPTNGALYFWNPATATSKWVWSRPVTDQIGRHVFAK